MKNYPNLHLSHSYKRNIIFSLISAFVLIIANYFANNASVFTGESITQYYWFQRICSWVKLKEPVDYGDAIYFNISYDKQFVPAYEGNYEGGSLYGNNIITDRKLLWEFLSLLKGTDTYKYIILDIAFDDVRDKTEYDDSLFNTIKSMRDIVFVDMEDINLSRVDLYNKKAKAFYYYTPIETNFARYQYTFNDTASIAAHVYEAIHPENKIKRYGIAPFNLYFSNNNLCYNSLFLTFDENSAYTGRHTNDIKNNSFDEIQVFHLGQFLRENENEIKQEVSHKCNDRFVVICNTESDDVHDIYAGVHIPGAQIIMRALTSLSEGRHIVSFCNSLYWFIVFFLICFASVSDKSALTILYNKIPLFRRKILKFWHFILSFISISSILLLASFFEYVVWDRVTSIILPILYFSIISLYLKFKQTTEKK